MSSPTFSVVEAAQLLQRTPRAVRKACAEGGLSASLERGSGGCEYRIQLDDLPVEAQHRYLAQQLKAAHRPADRREALERLNLDEQAEREVARMASITRKPRPLQRLPLTVDESQAARLAFEELCAGAQDDGNQRASIMLHLTRLDPSLPMMERYRLTAEAADESVTTLRRWFSIIKNLEFRDWAPALAPAWGKGRPKRATSDAAMSFIRSEWACQSQPPLLPIYRRAVKEAQKQGWELPSYKTVLRHINAIPAPQRAYLREGDEGLGRYFPDARRKFSTLRVNEMWNSDGRPADVHCVWPDGYVGRPILMGWQELRTRKILGWSIDKTESAELVRRSFRNAAVNSGAVPEIAYLDNGRGYASKQITGGQATRNRFKINRDDPVGVLTLFGIKAMWATPYNGKSKPIESFWNTVAKAEKCAAFAGSYCGNRPHAKPEEFTGKPIPIEAYIAFVRETIDEKNAREGHRGEGMDVCSPNELYAALIATTPVVAPTARQLHLCLMAVERVKLDKSHALNILGNRYWCEQLTQLEHRGPYQARYNPDDMNEPVALYDGREFICEVPLWREGEFRNQAAAKDHAREKRRFKRAQRESAEALRSMERSRRSWESDAPALPATTGGSPPAPRPKVARPVLLPLELHLDRSKVRTVDQAERDQAEFEAALEIGMKARTEGLRRANGGD